MRAEVTLVMPVRNEGPAVERTMASMFAQTRLPDEIVVADGASTDDTVERLRRFADRGVPLRIVPNPRVNRAAGLNAATEAASYEVIVVMDFGNRADPGWLDAMVRPFEEDSALDYLGGAWFPILDGSFTRICGAVMHPDDCLAALKTPEELERLAANVQSPLPGGMCSAYRRTIWERAGGFCEWTGRGQDRMFGLRVRKIGGRIGVAVHAHMYHHMVGSFRELYDRYYNYGIWTGRTGLRRPHFRHLTRIYGAGAALAIGSLFFPWLVAPLVLMVLLYVHFGAWRKLGVVGRATGYRFRPREHVVSVGVLFLRDAAVIIGNVIGSVDRLARLRWRRLTRRYIEDGQ